MGKKISNIIPIFIIPLAFFYFLIDLLPSIEQFQEVDLAGLRWDIEPNMIALQDMERENNRGLLFIRLKDGKEQFIAGNWQADFSDSGNVYAFGEFPDGYFDQTGQQIYAVIDGRKVIDINLDNLADKKIVSIQENPAGTYLFIEASSDSSTIYCLTEGVGGGRRECQQLSILTSVSQGLWNPNQPRELVIKTKDGAIVVHDPWEKDPHLVSPVEEPERYIELASLFDRPMPKANKINAKDEEFRYWQFLNLMMIKDADSWRFFKTPFGARLAWLIDGQHLLLKEADGLGVIEYGTDKIAPVLRENISDKKVELRNQSFDLVI